MTDVSIIIPTYNRLWSLPQTIDSCRGTICSVEIIVVDDGSTDGTADWLRQQNDLVIIHQENQGKCWAANSGYQAATGKYVRFLDSDDLLDTLSIDEQFALAESEHADVVVSGYKVINDDLQILRTQTWIECDDFISQQLGETDSSHYSSYLFKKDILQDIPHRPDFAFRDDRLMVLELALKNPVVAIHRGCALLHRSHQNNRLQFNSGMQQTVQNYQHFQLYKRILNRLQAEDRLTERRKKASIQVLWNLCHWIAKHNIADAEKVYEFIKSLDPSFAIPERGAIGLLYNKLGFKQTEKILSFRRLLKYGFE